MGFALPLLFQSPQPLNRFASVSVRLFQITAWMDGFDNSRRTMVSGFANPLENGDFQVLTRLSAFVFPLSVGLVRTTINGRPSRDQRSINRLISIGSLMKLPVGHVSKFNSRAKPLRPKSARINASAKWSGETPFASFRRYSLHGWSIVSKTGQRSSVRRTVSISETAIRRTSSSVHPS